jgi:hypothetical protein
LTQTTVTAELVIKSRFLNQSSESASLTAFPRESIVAPEQLRSGPTALREWKRAHSPNPAGAVQQVLEVIQTKYRCEPTGLDRQQTSSAKILVPRTGPRFLDCVLSQFTICCIAVTYAVA